MFKWKFHSYVDFRNHVKIWWWIDVNKKIPSFAKLLPLKQISSEKSSSNIQNDSVSFLVVLGSSAANTVIERLQLAFLAMWISILCSETVTFFSITDGEEKTYGGCEGPDAMYVKLISSDGHEFIVKREHALTSGTIKAMLSGPGKYRKLSTFTSFVSLLDSLNFYHAVSESSKQW